MATFLIFSYICAYFKPHAFKPPKTTYFVLLVVYN